MACPYEVRGALPADEDQLLDVARHLNTVNLPADRDEIRGLLDHAQKSFTGAVKDPRRREYVFVLVDTQSGPKGTPSGSDRPEGRIVGTSMIIGQLGRRDAPYIYVAALEEDRHPATPAPP